MPLIQALSGKRILLTGSTGFLGKVILEKLLYSVPQIGKIYVLIRGKQGSKVAERFKKEIVSSQCFDRLREKHQYHFDSFIDEKVQTIQGDLTKPGLGFTNATLEQLVNNCEIIINSAASIDFNARLDEAIASNITGTLMMMDLARKCHKLLLFTHISTCYVNCYKKGLIHETPVQQTFPSPVQRYEQLLTTPLKTLISETPNIIKGFPNTYTFTKNLTEQIIGRTRGSIPMCIVRPAIINTSYKEPYSGWVDAVSAAQATYLFGGLGVLTEVLADPKLIGDVVPVDYVSSHVIVATARNLSNQQLTVYHVGSSDLNPITWGQMLAINHEFWNKNKARSRAGPAVMELTPNENRIKYLRLKQDVQLKVYSKLAPYLGKLHIKESEKMRKTIQRSRDISHIFQFFSTHQWVFEMIRFNELIKFLSEEEQQIFDLDVSKIDMHQFLVINQYGLQKYILREDIEISCLGTDSHANLLNNQKESTYFSDIKWAWSFSSVEENKFNSASFKTRIMGSTRVLQAIDSEVLLRMELPTYRGYSPADLKRVIMKEAQRAVSQIVGQVNMSVIRFMAWTLHKIFRRIYEKINVNMEALKRIQQTASERGVPLILMPTHKSYLDFLIVSYIFYAFRFKLPHVITHEVIMHTSILPSIIRNSGAFFYRKEQFKNSTVYRVIFSKYIELLLRDNHNLEIFLEGSRSRSGKILQPEIELLETIVESAANGKLMDAYLVPITINYEKVLEGDTFPLELLGENKVQESLLRVVKAVPLLRSNFGRVYVQICDPIFLRDQMQGLVQDKSQGGLTLEGANHRFKNYLSYDVKQRPEILRQVTKSLALRITRTLTERTVIMSTGIVSAVLLQYRRGVSQDLMVKSVNWIAKYILNKGYKIGGINQYASTVTIRHAIGYLSEIIVRAKNSIFELQLSAATDFNRLLMLSYYRNTIVHAFLPEAFICSALVSFGTQMGRKEGVEIERLKEASLFLQNLLQRQFVTHVEVMPFEQKLKQLCDGQTLSLTNSKRVIISHRGEKVVMFQYSLLRPLLECYWSCATYLMTISRTEDQHQENKTLDQFYNIVQWYVDSLYEQKVIEHYQACSLETICNSVSRMRDLGLITIKQDRKKLSVSVSAPQKLAAMETQIKFFLQNVNLNPFVPVMPAAKTSLLDSRL